jgi:hypothetical protein
MAKPKGKTEGSDEGVLVKAAKTIGTAAGKLASAAGMKPSEPRKTGKLVKKNKSRLPRRQKKAARKAAKQAQ